jgi:hypothetical protein
MKGWREARLPRHESNDAPNVPERTHPNHNNPRYPPHDGGGLHPMNEGSRVRHRGWRTCQPPRVKSRDQALRNVTRQYLVGDLQKPQALQHIPSALIDIGMTR